MLSNRFYFSNKLFCFFLDIIFIIEYLSKWDVLLFDPNEFISENIVFWKGKSYKKISEVVTKSTRKKFPQSWIFNILKKEKV